MTRLFGRLRAGAKAFPDNIDVCPTCGQSGSSTSHILRRCNSTRHCRNEWLLQLAPKERSNLYYFSDDDFAARVFDLGSWEEPALGGAIIRFVWDALAKAHEAAGRRRGI